MTRLWQVTALDVSSPGTDVIANAVQGGLSQLTGTVALQSAAEVSLSLLFVFDPSSASGDPKDRLEVFLGLHGEGHAFKVVELAISSSLLTRVLRPVKTAELTKKLLAELGAVCDVARHETTERPVLPPGCDDPAAANPHCPSVYWTCVPLHANEDNAWMPLDELLHRLDRRVVLRVVVTPGEVMQVRTALASYGAQLEATSRGHTVAEEAERELRGGISASSFDPLRARHRDRRANEIMQELRMLPPLIEGRALAWNARVLAATAEDAELVAACAARCAFADDGWDLQADTLDRQERLALPGDCLHGAVRPVKSALDMLTGRDAASLRPLGQLLSSATADELAGLLRLPATSTGWLHCIRARSPLERERTGDLILGHELNWQDPTSADALAGGTDFGIRVADMALGVAILGLPGCGKTTAMFRLLKHSGCPFILFEMKKKEYREFVLAELRRGNEIRLYTLGADYVAPFRLNPCEMFSGETREQMVDWLCHTLTAYMSLEGSGPSLLRQAIEDLYHKADPENPPLLRELHDQLRVTFEKQGYTADTQADMLTMLQNRIYPLISGAVGRVFQCRHSTPGIAELLRARSVIEMNDLAADPACFVAFVLLRMIDRYVGRHPA
jgi:hypothetical protein